MRDCQCTAAPWALVMMWYLRLPGGSGDTLGAGEGIGWLMPLLQPTSGPWRTGLLACGCGCRGQVGRGGGRYA